MANWLYNGVELPALPTVEGYPHAYIVPQSGYTQLIVSATSWEVLEYDNTTSFEPFGEGESLEFVIIPGLFDSWEKTGYVSFSAPPLWANTDVLKTDDSLYLAASAPIRVDSKLAISIGTSKALYNGVELPALPEWDKEAYPHAIISRRNVSTVTNSAPIWQYTLSAYEYHNYGQRVYSDGSVYEYYGTDIYDTKKPDSIVYRLTDSDTDWVQRENLKWVEPVGKEYLATSADEMIWTNFDLHYSDGSLYCAESTPVPVGDYNRATFTCTNLNTTDSVYKIAAWCYPKGTKWSDAPHTYVSAANFPGKNHSESWTLSGLTEGTEYELYASILVDDVATDHNALVTFTTDGVLELDFSNATLTVTDSTTSSTEFQFEMYYTGLPYNADGTSAMFHIVGVTDAGDEAIMGWRATSGDGYMSGVFFDLEPLTDYTATFEVYYNGKPTGVTVSVDFTTEEKTGGGFDRDSFLLGFASGLGCTAATKDGAEYNTWAQGYIVGNALRAAITSAGGDVEETWAEMVGRKLYIHTAYNAVQSGDTLEVT